MTDRVVWKYFVHHKEVVEIPYGADILSAGIQNGHVVVWALVDPELRKTPYKFFLYYTGSPASAADKKAVFLDTLQYPNGLVVHVFYERGW